MDLLPKTVVHIRSEARSTVYRAALDNPAGYAYGFLLGNREIAESPAIEFSLVSATPGTVTELWEAPTVLRSQIRACENVATRTKTEPVGLFAAWEFYFEEPKHQLLGLWVDTALSMKIPYVVVFSTLAHEADWAPCCYFANCFPHDCLSSRIRRGKLSLDPKHNPRRVRSLWNHLLAETADRKAE